MKKIALILNYASFIALFLSLLTESSLLLQSIKYILLIVAGYMLFRITNVYGRQSLFHTFNYSFISVAFLFVIYALLAQNILYTNITIQLVVASIIGFGLSLMYEEPVKRVKKTDIRPPEKPKARKVKKTTKTSKRTASKKTAKKATRKTSAKQRRGPGRPPKNKATKKTSTKTSKRSSSKKAAKKTASKKSSNNKN